MAKLTLVVSRRNKNSGRLERAAGKFSSNVPNKRYTEVFVTDCKRNVKIDGRIYPGAHQVFSFTEPDFAEANSQLNLKGDLYIYVRAKGSYDDYSNAYKIPKKGPHENVGDLKAFKKKNIKEFAAALSELNNSINRLNWAAKLALKASLLDLADDITDKMADLAKKREEMEADLKAKKAYYKKMFGKKKEMKKKVSKKKAKRKK